MGGEPLILEPDERCAAAFPFTGARRGLLWALLLLAGCVARPAPGETDRAAVQARVEAYVAMRDARDVAGVEACLHPEVDQLTSRGEWRRGVDASLAGMRRSSATNPGERTITVETVRFVGAEVALVDARYVIAGADGGEDRRLWSTFLLVREADAWKITGIRNMQPAE